MNILKYLFFIVQTVYDPTVVKSAFRIVYIYQLTSDNV